MSQTPRHIKTDRSLNRPTERRAEKAPASRPVQPAQPDFFAEEKPAPAEPPRRAGGSGGAKPPRRSAPAGGNEPPRRRKKKKKTPLWLPLAVTLAVLAVISGVVVYAVGMVGRVEENLRPEEDAPSITEEIQNLVSVKGAANPLMFVVLLVGVQGVAEFLVSGILGGIVARAVHKFLK